MPTRSSATHHAKRALVIGHFSTIGDVESLELVEGVLATAGIGYDVAPYKAEFVPALPGAIPIRSVRPSDYSHLVAVCGPFWPDFLARHGIDFLRFDHCTRIGINLTMVLPLDQWNPFHLLLERDSSRTARPDATFLRDADAVPVAGLCTIARQREYGSRQRHGTALGLFTELIERKSLAAIQIDTRWPRRRNGGGLGSPAEVMSVIGRTDVLLTNRLHGLVYALKAGVPALALDPVAGGDKVSAQARVLDWPAVGTAEQASPEWMDQQLDWCLSEDGRAAALAVAGRARRLLETLPEDLRAALTAAFDYQPVPRSPLPASGLVKRLTRALRARG